MASTTDSEMNIEQVAQGAPGPNLPVAINAVTSTSLITHSKVMRGSGISGATGNSGNIVAVVFPPIGSLSQGLVNQDNPLSTNLSQILVQQNIQTVITNASTVKKLGKA